MSKLLAKIGILKLSTNNYVYRFSRKIFDFLNNLSIPFGRFENFRVRLFLDQTAKTGVHLDLKKRLQDEISPTISVHANLLPYEIEEAKRFVTLFADEFNKKKLGLFKSSNAWVDEINVIHSHLVGGTIMGETFDSSVVDRNCKVHGVENLYISGPSVFPTNSFCNPFYTIGAVSIRLGEHINAIE